jgi:hypothetical protein
MDGSYPATNQLRQISHSCAQLCHKQSTQPATPSSTLLSFCLFLSPRSHFGALLLALSFTERVLEIASVLLVIASDVSWSAPQRKAADLSQKSNMDFGVLVHDFRLCVAKLASSAPLWPVV